MKLKTGSVAIACLVLAFATGCSSSSDSDQSDGSSRGSDAELAEIKVAIGANDATSPDPAFGYSSIVSLTTQGLLTYTPRQGNTAGTIVAGLAEAVPEPTDDGKTYTFAVRPGVKYSDGTDIKADDFKFSIERLFRSSNSVSSKFSLLEGAPEFASSKTGGIPGIAADNEARTVTFTLTEAMPTFNELMGIYLTAPLPSDTPVTNDLKVPSTGQMMVESFKAGQGYTLVKNPHFNATTDLKAANVDKIVAEVVSDPKLALDKTLSGDYDYNAQPVPADQIAAILRDHKDQISVSSETRTYMFTMNASRAPFSDVRVRRAVNFALDRAALQKLAGGALSSTQNVLPPTETSYRKIEPFDYDMAKAKSLIADAGAEGTAVTMWGVSTQQPAAVYAENQLRAIGLKPSLKIIPESTFYSALGKEATAPDINWSNWNELVPDASDWIGPLYDGTRINGDYTTNQSYFDDPEVNTEINAASALPLGAERDEAWAALESKLIEDLAVSAPYGYPLTVAVFSPRLDPSCFSQYMFATNVEMANFCGK